MGLEQEIAAGEREGGLHRRLRRVKAFMHRHPALRILHKVLVTLLGGIIVLAGLVMLVTPGPGWLAIFLGLGVLATEYPVVHRFNTWCKAKVLAAWHGLRARRERRRWRRARARVLARRGRNGRRAAGSHRADVRPRASRTARPAAPSTASEARVRRPV